PARLRTGLERLGCCPDRMKAGTQWAERTSLNVRELGFPQTTASRVRARSEPPPSGKASSKRNLRQKAAEDWPHSKTWRESCVRLLAKRLGVRPVLCRFHNLLRRNHFENEFLRRRAL